ncbi:MAG TPA: acyl carrier protein [Acidobacteriaceae bacterium]
MSEHSTAANPKMQETMDAVLEVLKTNAGLTTELSPDEDFYDAGVTSVMALPILLDLEDHFQISIEDTQFIEARTLRSVAELVLRIRDQQ